MSMAELKVLKAKTSAQRQTSVPPPSQAVSRDRTLHQHSSEIIEEEQQPFDQAPVRRARRRKQGSEAQSAQARTCMQEGTAQGQEETSVSLTEEEAEAKQSFNSAMAKAVGLLGKRAYTTAEMAEKLRKRDIPPDIIEKVQARLTALGALDDAAYARLFIPSKWRQSKRGPSLLRQDMLRRGLEAPIVDAALRAFFGDEQGSLRVTPRMRRGAMQGRDGGGDGAQGGEQVRTRDLWKGGRAAGHGDTGDDESWNVGDESGSGDGNGDGEALGDQLLEVVSKRQAFLRHLPEETQRRRLAGFLQRRGHSWGTIRQILQQLGLLR